MNHPSECLKTLAVSREFQADSNGTKIGWKKRGEKMAIFVVLPAFTRGLTPLRFVSHLASRVLLVYAVDKFFLKRSERHSAHTSHVLLSFVTSPIRRYHEVEF